MSDGRSIRSVMFTPALRIDRFEYALKLGADVCLLDCEDSVSMNDKNEARENLCAYLSQAKNTSKSIGVRINSIQTPEGIADILALNKCQTMPNYILVPKVENSSDLPTVMSMLESKTQNIRLLALVETVKGIQNVEEIAASSANLCALMFGAADYVNSIIGEICWDTLLVPRTMIVYAACKNNLGAIDTPYFSIEDITGLTDECKRVKMLGFNGRGAIHPSQVSIINKIFSYSSLTIEEAERIIDAARKSNGNICQVNGKMIGAPIINQALRRLEMVSLYD